MAGILFQKITCKLCVNSIIIYCEDLAYQEKVQMTLKHLLGIKKPISTYLFNTPLTHLIFETRLCKNTSPKHWPVARKLHEDTRDNILNELDGKELRLEGLSAEEIGKWIKIVRGVNLQLNPELKRIRENSAGLPLLLDDWIKKNPTLDYEEIKWDRPCEQLLKLKKDLSDEDKINLSRISILLYPLEDYQKLAQYLQIKNNDNIENDAADIIIIPFIERLIERGIFDRNYKWFRHEVIKKCFDAELREEQRKRYHNRAADFYLKLLEQQPQQPNDNEDADKKL